MKREEGRVHEEGRRESVKREEGRVHEELNGI